MNKRFIVLLERSTKEQNDAFLSFAKKHKLGWWHWIPNAWLLKGKDTTINASEIREAARDAYGSANNFVIELNEDGDTWSGFGPKTEKRNMFNWIHRNWKQD